MPLGTNIRRAISVKPAGTWSGTAVDTVLLDYDDRHRRRLAMTGENRTHFLLDLPETTVLRDGDGLVLDDGGVIRVKAAAERLLEITCRDAEHLVRVAWHLGNRHLATQVSGTRLLIRDDYVIANMVRGLGAETRVVEAPFDPEGGAYGHGATEGHSHGHGHSHEHGHDPEDHEHRGDRGEGRPGG